MHVKTPVLPSPVDEARRLTALFAGEGPALIAYLSGQLAVLKSQAQMIMGLSGLVITVTGFSGHHMVRGGALSTAAMVCGILCTLLGVLITVQTLAKLRWVSQDLVEDLEETAARVIGRRNREQRSLLRAGLFVACGLASYLVAVVLAALHTGAI